jgi:hypothetical protein
MANKFKQSIKKIILEHMSEIDFSDYDEDSLEYLIDMDKLVQKINDHVETLVLTFRHQPRGRDNYELSCSYCGRIYGDWITSSGHQVNDETLKKNGQKIIVADNL